MDISALKLQKLLYYAQGHYLLDFDEALINETFEAWPQGPVVPSVYREFKRQWHSEAAQRYGHLDPQFKNEFVVEEALIERNLRVMSLAAFIIDRYGAYSAHELVEMTHQANSPWSLAYVPGQSNLISDSSIKASFTRSLPGI